MKNFLPILILMLSFGTINAQSVNKLKKQLLSSIEQKSDELITMSDNIWHAAELAFREEKSAQYLMEYAKLNGFDVDSDLAGMPTAFTATYGEGSPVIGIIGEFDALPGLSQTTVPYKNQLKEGEAGEINEKPEIGIDGKIRPLRETLKSPGGASTDSGDVSYNVPVVSLAATTAPKGVPWHSWSVVASSGMSIGHKGMLHAAKALGMTMVDIFKDNKLREDIKKEFDEKIGEYEYDAYLDPGPPPLDYVD